MALRINNDVKALSILRNLGQAQTAGDRSIGRLSSGLRISRAADDSAGLAIANQLKAEVGSLRVATRNAEQAGSLLAVAEGGLQGIQQVLFRMQELASQSVSDNVDGDSRALIDAEYQELLSEIDRIADNTTFSGTNLLNSTATTMNFVVGAAATNTISFTTLDVGSLTLGVGVGEEAVEGDGIFVGAIALGDGAGGGTAADGAAAMTAISTAIDSLATAFSSVGATQSRLDSALNQAQIALENTAAAESVIRDVDFASEFTSLTKSQILSQTGISVLAQSNSRAQSVLALLQ